MQIRVLLRIKVVGSPVFLFTIHELRGSLASNRWPTPRAAPPMTAATAPYVQRIRSPLRQSRIRCSDKTCPFPSSFLEFVASTDRAPLHRCWFHQRHGRTARAAKFQRVRFSIATNGNSHSCHQQCGTTAGSDLFERQWRLMTDWAVLNIS